MWVESRPGEGSKFSFTIVAEIARGEVPEPAALEDLRGKRVLIVDDNDANRVILAKQTASWGLHAETACSGPEALARAAAGERFDLAILDYLMPEMDGFDLARQLRAIANAPSRMILLSSLGASEADNGPGSRALFAAALTKPVRQEQLRQVILEIFAVKPVEAAPPPRRAVLDPKLADRVPLQILVAEDNQVNQKVVVRVLNKLGYRPEVAANGVEALEALALRDFDVVLMDMQMPEMDGLEATRRIRARNGPRPWIIAMTASAMEEDRRRCLEAGMDDFLSKPVAPLDLAEALERRPQGLESPSAIAG
jgi:CheY-like chemotaxis protein